MSPKKSKYSQTLDDGTILHRDYCFLIDGEKYNRNIACKRHDNIYGVNGGGTPDMRKQADLLFYQHLKSNQDPMAFLSYMAVRLCGWAFFNYESGALWTGQLIKKLKYCNPFK